MARSTVVLLHGLGRSASNMLVLKWRLAARGYRVCNIDYETRIDRVEIAADFVHAELANCVAPDQPVHFVTHSLGGLVLRSLLARHPGAIAQGGRAVMLAPPNHGSEIVDRLRYYDWIADWTGRLSAQLGTRAADLPSVLPSPSVPFGIIAGNRSINPMGYWLLPKPHDGTVSVASTRLDGMSDHLILPHTHTFIMNASEVADQVDAFLRNGRFDPQVDDRD